MIDFTYPERLLQITDRVKPREYGGRIAFRREWERVGLLTIWKECSSFDQWLGRAKSAGIGATSAKQLDKEFASSHRIPPLNQSKKRKSGAEELRDLLGL
jgi:hypothetical protein